MRRAKVDPTRSPADLVSGQLSGCGLLGSGHEIHEVEDLSLPRSLHSGFAGRRGGSRLSGGGSGLGGEQAQW